MLGTKPFCMEIVRMIPKPAALGSARVALHAVISIELSAGATNAPTEPWWETRRQAHHCILSTPGPWENNILLDAPHHVPDAVIQTAGGPLTTAIRPRRPP